VKNVVNKFACLNFLHALGNGIQEEEGEEEEEEIPLSFSIL